jgi:type IV fimbrial biogenesis protein FimT
MVTLSVIAILLTLGVVGFQNLIAHNRITSAANGLIAHLQLARSEAVTRGVPVTVCPSLDGANCANQDPAIWNNGYIVAVTDAAGATQVLRRVDAGGMAGLKADSGGRPKFVFKRDGTARGTNGTVKICDPKDTSRVRLVVVHPLGRSYVKCSDPNAYSCPDCP